MLLSHWKEWNNAFAATWMDLETVILSEDSQTEKVKYDMTYMCNLKEYDTKGLIYKTETDSQFRE